MAKHEVICSVCKEKFDTNVIQAVRTGARRYAHAACAPNNTDFVPLGTEADPEFQDLKSYINKLFKTPNWSMCMKEIKKFREENGYSYSGIKKSLIYFYEVKGNSTEKANNHLGIVPFIYQDAYNYYLSLFLAQQGTQDKTLVVREKEIVIKPPKKRGTKFKLFNIEVEENEK